MKIIFSFLFSIVLFNGYSQFSLPKIGTTKEKAFLDLNNNITNEQWFSYKQDDGTISYSKLFKSTPVGIRHALNEYEDLAKAYNKNDCTDKSLYSNMVKDYKGEIDYDNLSLSIKMESSEIKKACLIKDDVIVSFQLSSAASKPNSFLTIIVITNLKE